MLTVNCEISNPEQLFIETLILTELNLLQNPF